LFLMRVKPRAPENKEIAPEDQKVCKLILSNTRKRGKRALEISPPKQVLNSFCCRHRPMAKV
jgi:hypothetical protein